MTVIIGSFSVQQTQHPESLSVPTIHTNASIGNRSSNLPTRPRSNTTERRSRRNWGRNSLVAHTANSMSTMNLNPSVVASRPTNVSTNATSAAAQLYSHSNQC